MQLDKTTMFFALLGLFFVVVALYSSWAGIIGAASFILAIINQSRRQVANRELKEHLKQTQLEPSIAPVIDLVQKVSEPTKVSWDQIQELSKKAAKNIRDEKDLTPSIIGIVGDLVKMMNIDGDGQKYYRPYSLALAYRISLDKDLQEGCVARNIDSSVRKRKVIKCYQETWQLANDDIDWYTKFSSTEDILGRPFKELFVTTQGVDPKKVGQNRDAALHEASVLQEHLRQKEEKLQKLFKIIMSRIPLGDFLRLISSLRSDVVIISLQGTSDPNERVILQSRAPSGSRYLRQVFEAEQLRLGKINDGVYFVFLRDIIPPDQDPKYFDIGSWGRSISEKASVLRRNDRADGRKFNFIAAKSSIYEIKSFGDELSEAERNVEIPPSMFKSIRSEDLTFSTLLAIAEILRKVEDISIFDFINRNIEYLDGVPDTATAGKISQMLRDRYQKNEWLISDFVQYGVKVIDLERSELSIEQASKILADAEFMSKMLLM